MSDKGSPDYTAIVGTIAGVLSLLVALLALEWAQLRPWLSQKLKRRPTSGGAPVRPITPGQIVAAMSAVVAAGSAYIIATRPTHEAAKPPTAGDTQPAKPPVTAKPPAAGDVSETAAAMKTPDAPKPAAPEPAAPKPTPTADDREARMAPMKVPATEPARPRVTKIPWASWPNSYAVEDLKSAKAKEERIAGSATVECELAPGGVIWQKCKVLSETPEGYGFGETALAYVAKSTLHPDYDFAVFVASQNGRMSMVIPIRPWPN